MRILLIGEIYSENLGDGVICDCVTWLIKKNFANCTIDKLDLSYNVGVGKRAIDEYYNKKNKLQKRSEFIFKFNNLKIIKKLTYLKFNFINKSQYLKNRNEYIKNKKIINEFINLKYDYDFAIFAGGQLFMDYFSYPIYTYVRKLSKRNIPILFNACGAGPIKSKVLIYKLKKSLNNNFVKGISTRDDIYGIKKLYLTTNKNIKKTYDPALFTKEVYGINKKKNSKIVGLGVMKTSNMDNNALKELWKNIISELEKKHIRWKMFCNGSPWDYEFAKEILLELGYCTDLDTYLCKRPQVPQELVQEISNFKSIISFRLHSHIIAYSLDIPSIALVWDEKLKFFFSSNKKLDRCMYIDESPLKIVEKLLDIENTSYDMNLISNQKYTLENDLNNMINSVLI